MSDDRETATPCATCGEAIPTDARYCPNCGTRQPRDRESEDQAFQDAIAEVVESPAEADRTLRTPRETDPGEPTSSEVGVSAPPTPSLSNEQQFHGDAIATSSPSSRQDEGTWSATPGSWNTTASPPLPIETGSGCRRRPLWIALGIVGFLLFCCCALTFGLVAAGANDASFQSDISSFTRQ